MEILLTATALLGAFGFFLKRVLPPLADFLERVLPLVLDSANKRAVRLAKAKQNK